MSWQQEKEELGKEVMEGLYEQGMILTWYRDNPDGWKLVSGLWSPVYVNLRLLPSSPKLYRKVGNAMGMLLEEIGYQANSKDKLVGVAMAGIPIADSISLLYEIPALYTRKLPDTIKTPEDLKKHIELHGQHALVEGSFNNGDRLGIVDDLVTRFDSKLLAISQVKEEARRRKIVEIELKDIVVLLDREQGAVERARELGYNLHSLIPFLTKGLDWLKDKFSEEERAVIPDYLKNSGKYQDEELKQKLKQQAMKK